jgi:hypothetical protein
MPGAVSNTVGLSQTAISRGISIVQHEFGFVAVTIVEMELEEEQSLKLLPLLPMLR